MTDSVRTRPPLFAKIAEFQRSIGLANTCLFVLSRLLSTLFGPRIRLVKYYFVAQPIVTSSSPTSSGSFHIEFVDAGWAPFSQVERPSHVIAQRFAQGARCLAATKEDELAGMLWFVVGAYDEDEVRARFRPMPKHFVAWDFDVTVMPRYRMGRLFSYLWSHAQRELAAQGVTHSVSRISAFNGPSLAAHRRLGAKVVGSALFFCVGRVQLMKSSVRPRWHLSWRDDQRPCLDIGP